MEKFYEMINVSKQIIHYQNFMLQLHNNIHSLNKSSSADKVIYDLAKEIADKSKVICLDEFEIKDITDAMIIMRLFKYLRKKNIFIFITTNTPPDDLYQDGLQRELFLPFIGRINKHYTIFNLDSKIDYRISDISQQKNRLFYPLNKDNIEQLDKIKHKLCKKEELSSKIIKNFGREITFTKAHQNILFTDFNELILQNLSASDYVKITQEFNIIILENIREIEELETDIIIRFISFIDNVYFNKSLLFASFYLSPEKIYTKGKRVKEYKRTISRLSEMNSPEYLSHNY
jgi:cell division protein ZapE